MLKVPPISAQGSSEALRSCGRLDETSKKGLCWSELKRSGMSQWGVCRLVKFENKNDDPQMSSIVVKELEDKKDDGEAVTTESPIIPEIRKRKSLTLSQDGEERGAKCANVRQQSSSLDKCKKNKLEKSKERWSADRYKLAEQNMLDIMKDEGAVFENPISRPALRTAARKRIGDTGLLDHLLKHIDGRVAPGGTERFRRCYNTDGVMEYWLESADLVKIKREAGVPDPNYIPPSWWKHGGGPSQDSVCSEELKLLKAEMEKMKRDMHKMISKQQEQEQHNPIEEMHKELVKWKAKTDQHLMEISGSLSGMQDMYNDLIKWKAKIEQQLLEISNSLSSMQSSKNCTTLSPSYPERWEDWLESTNLDDIQAEDFVPLLGNGDLVNVGGEIPVRDLYSVPPPQLKTSSNHSQDSVCARELELLKEEMAKMKRDVQELVPRRQEEDQANVTPDSSLTTNSKSDPDNSVLLFQEMFKELIEWKAKMEQQLTEISNTVSAMHSQSYRLR